MNYSIEDTDKPKVHAIYLFNDLLESSHYVKLVAFLINLPADNLVYIYFDSTGGDYHTSVVLSNAIKICKAKVIGVVMCRCYSGATAIALSCDQICVKKRGSFMVHNCRIWRDLDGIYINELCNWVRTEYHIWEKFFTEVYVNSGFLTKDEATGILDEGNELYITTNDLRARLDRIGILCSEDNCAHKI